MTGGKLATAVTTKQKQINILNHPALYQGEEGVLLHHIIFIQDEGACKTS